MSTLAEEKRALRVLMRSRREALSVAERAAASNALSLRMDELPEWRQARVVASYAPVRGELDPIEATASATVTVTASATASPPSEPGARARTIVYPRVVPAAVPRLTFHAVTTTAELVPDAYGIPAPRPDAPVVPLASIDLFLVPGLAFDRRGARLGQGGGYYDDLGRWLAGQGSAGRARARLVGLGYDFQLVDACPVGEGDIGLDALVTDARVLRFVPSHFDRSGGPVSA